MKLGILADIHEHVGGLGRAIDLLTRHGIEVVLVKDEQCCGALTHHIGRHAAAMAPRVAAVKRRGSGRHKPSRAARPVERNAYLKKPL